MMGERSIEVPLAGELLAEEPLVRGSFAEVLSSQPVEVVHDVLVTVVAKPAWAPADISSCALGFASD
jgi:hypothetical protein